MFKDNRFYSNFFVFSFVVFLLSSCSITRPTGATEAEVLYKEAKALMKDSRYIMATEKLNSIRSKYPYSIYATSSELLLADVLYAQENFVESAAAYLLFKDFHPKYKNIDYVILRTAESFYQQIPTFDRDLGSAFEAIKYYRELINFYPKSDKVKEASDKISKCQDKIRKKEKYIADFYFKTEVYDAAQYRYLDILNSFKMPKELMDHSKTRIVQTSLLLNKKDDCIKYYNLYSSDVSKVFRNQMEGFYEECK